MTTRTYWLSKYALSDGIKELTGEESVFNGSSWVDVDGWRGSFKLGRDIHDTREEALDVAEAARIKKIASLRKQIAKLEALKFEE